MGLDMESRIRNVTAVLGPTNTGKTHLAIERMLGHDTGMIGLPLRLLAREVYDRVVQRVGVDKVALITGEEKIKPESPRFWVSTVEAMPREIDVDFLAVDEIQLAADPERGHVFTNRLLHARGKVETLMLGAGTMRECIADLIPGANFISRPRLSKLTYAGQKKITRLPARSAIVAFSASEVYAIAELIRRQRGGAAVVLGALSPRTRNAQVALYQSGDVDFLVATDAIGMGLNLNVDHVAFSATRKFDGHAHRALTAGELGQIAGRAGRHMNDGTFGVTGDAEPLDQDLIDRLENHTFDPIKTLQWRNRDLDFATLDRLRDSLREAPREARLQRARMADDVTALEQVAGDPEIIALTRGPAAVGKLWDVCQIPDYQKISGQNHAEMVAAIFKFLQTGEELIPEDWFAKQVAFADRTDGDIDTLSNRIAHIRTWTFVANRPGWLKQAEHWQGRTREIEDNLSDALHEQLTQRFVDKRTSALMKGMRDKDEMKADIADDGAIHVESHYVGRLKGFRFSPAADTQAEGIHAKAARNAAAHVLAKELSMRARRVAAAKSDAFKLTRNARILWRGEEIARLEPGEDPLKPLVVLLVDEHLQGPDKEKVQERLSTWATETIAERLKPLVAISKAEDISGLARGIAFRLTENFGILKRESVAEEIKSLDQTSRQQLRKYGVRFGAFNIFFPALLKPAAAELTLALWALKHAAASGLSIDALPETPRMGLTSGPAVEAIPEAFYRAYGYHVCGPRAVRIDILERLADLIRGLLAWRATPEKPGPAPKGATGDGAFTVTPEMMSILGCSPDELGNVLKSLGFRVERRPVRPVAPAAAATPADETPASEPAAGDVPPVADAAARASEGPAEDAVVSPAEVEPAAAAGAGAEPEPSAPALAAATPEASPPEPAAIDPPTGETVVAAGVSSAPAETEQKFEEIWRPRRRREQPREHGRPDRERGRQHHRGKRDRNQQAATPAAASSSDASPPAAEAQTGDAAPRPQKPRSEGYRADRPRGGHAKSDEGQGERNRDRRPDDRKPRGERDRDRGRDNRRDDRRNREERGGFQMRSSSAPKKGGVDPDSPFAKLSALKQALEKRGQQEPGSS